ncbi:hypothetical protein [Pseudomonas sp. PB3P13]
MDSSLLSGEKKAARANLAVDTHRRKGTSKNAGMSQVITAHDRDDHSSLVTNRSLHVTACKLRA